MILNRQTARLATDSESTLLQAKTVEIKCHQLISLVSDAVSIEHPCPAVNDVEGDAWVVLHRSHFLIFFQRVAAGLTPLRLVP